MIELITVIVILAVLAATALPKFINIGSNARAAKVDAMAAQIHTLVTGIRADCMIKVPNCTTTMWQYHTIWGKTIPLHFGYPDAGNFINHQIAVLLDTNGWTVSLPNASAHKFSLTDAPTPADCSVVYTDAFDNGAQTKNFRLTVTKTGC